MELVALYGRLAQDVTETHTQDGKTIARSSVACRRSYSGDSDFHNVVAFGKNAENLLKCKKGNRVQIIGELQNNNYEKDGVKHYGYTVVVNQLEYVETKTEAHADEPKPSEDFMAIPEGMQEELPFV